MNPVKRPVFDPILEGSIDFAGKKIIKVMLADNMGYVVVHSLADAFDISNTGMRQRLNRSEYFQPYTAMIRVTGKGGPQAQLCLMAPAIPIFLAGVDLERVESAEGRERLKLFLDEVLDILAEHFGISERDEMRVMRQQIGMMTAERTVRQRAKEEGVDLNTAEELKKVRAEMAEMEKAHQETLGKMRQAFVDLRDSIRDYNRVAGDEAISEAQQGEVYLAVETLGQLLEEHGVVKPYPGIYMDVSRISGRASYKQIPKNKYQMVMDFLHKQIEALGKKKPAA